METESWGPNYHGNLHGNLHYEVTKFGTWSNRPERNDICDKGKKTRHGKMNRIQDS